MFKRDHVPVKILDISPKKLDQDDEEVALLEIACEINPFVVALAGELHSFVKGTLFTMTGVEVNSLLGGCSFTLTLPPQVIEVRAAHDQGDASFTILEAQIGNIKASRPKTTQAWKLTFTITCAPASEHQQAQIMACYLKTQYLCFSLAAPNLFESAVDETPREAKTGKRGRRLSAAETAELSGDAATH